MISEQAFPYGKEVLTQVNQEGRTSDNITFLHRR